MALEQALNQQSVSPSDSGRASPISRKWRSIRNEDDTPAKDKTYRRYASGVERSLTLFDTNLQEWADYISFLGRLLKSLQARPSAYTVVPSKALVAKRLAQCLNPSLPSGVHQKTLEVYNYIFTMIGKEALESDLPLYLPGLSSTLSFASLSVRGPYLSLLETHLLQLEARSLHPALKAIILALLPGLEEETSEDFERTLKLLNGFKKAVRPSQEDKPDSGQSEESGDEYFWQCFFLASITSNNRRLGALAYLVRYLPKLGQSLRRGSIVSEAGQAADEDALIDQQAKVVTSPEPGLLLRCFAAGLADEQLLIQRGFLDLLVSHLPLHSSVLQSRVKSKDLELLLTAAVGVVVRRDMSLNRRLWTWLLGPEPSAHEVDSADSPISPVAEGRAGIMRTRYFEEFGLRHLTQAILNIIHQNQSNPIERARPFRICLSLMDRWEIGGLVVPEIFLPVVRSVQRYQPQAKNKSDFSEVLRSASVFFDGVESGLIWGEMIQLLTEALSSKKLSQVERTEKLATVKFIINHFNVREEEMLLIHAPLTVLVLLLVENSKTVAPSSSEAEEISSTALAIALDLIEIIPERAFQSSTDTVKKSKDIRNLAKKDKAEVLKLVHQFYAHEQANLEASQLPFSGKEMTGLLLEEASLMIGKDLVTSNSASTVTLKARIFVSLLRTASNFANFDVSLLLPSIRERLSSGEQLPFTIFTTLTTIVTTIYSNSYMSLQEISGLVDPLVRQAWTYLSVTNPKFHVETVRCLWRLQSTLSLSNHEIEASICDVMTQSDVSGAFASRDSDPGRRFGILWNHTLQDHITQDRRPSKASVLEPQTPRLAGTAHYEVMLTRPLFLLLDSLLDERTQLSMTVRTWLQSMVGIDRLFHLFIAKFTTFNFLQTERDAANGSSYTYTEDDDLDQCVYYLRTLSSILRWSSDHVWAALADNFVSTDKSFAMLHKITGRDTEISLQEFFVHVCLQAIAGGHSSDSGLQCRIDQLHRTALMLLHQFLTGPDSVQLSELQLEYELIDRLHQSIEAGDPLIQISLLDVVFDALKIRNLAAANHPTSPNVEHKRLQSQENLLNQGSLGDQERESSTRHIISPPPSTLVKCLQAAFASSNTRTVLDSWIAFLTEVLPFYSETIFQILLPLVETFCGEIGKTFQELKETFKEPSSTSLNSSAPEATLVSLLNGLEQVLGRGHDRLVKDEARLPTAKGPDQPQGFFGNMVSGVFTSETPQTRSATANNRLTVLLTFQDAVRICFLIWSWGGRGPENAPSDPESLASFNYTSLRMRNRARRLLEHLFAAETLECLETTVDIWQKSLKADSDSSYTVVINLLHVLDGSRPKHTIPAIFNAIYSRTNPNALEPSRKSTLTSHLVDNDLVIFLVDYARSLEDDTMDEIWADCMAFLRDILANPFPHRQTLPSLLEFTAILGEKVDNTNFGEQRKMRRDLADLFLRLLTAISTTRSVGFLENASTASFSEKAGETDEPLSSDAMERISRSVDVVAILATITPDLPKILVDADRVIGAVNTISSSVIGPTFRSKSFPENINKNTLALLYHLTRLPNTQKIWKKDLADAFNDGKFFNSPVALVESDWLPLLRQWTVSDKDRLPELLSRMTPPTTAGIVFGVGATSARLEADRRTQLTLRRVATLILASAEDAFVSELAAIEEKLVEVLSATTISSPSSTTRGDVYMVIRALVIKTSPIHLAPLWPIVNAELQAAIGSVVAPDHSQTSETYNNFTILQACKLLDTLICVAPDDFQLHEWLFITDSIDAVYRPAELVSVGLVDELAEELGSTTLAGAHLDAGMTVSASGSVTRRPMLGPGMSINDEINLERKEELVGKILRPFFSQLSIFAFESIYSMASVDTSACFKDLLKDLFDERSITKPL